MFVGEDQPKLFLLRANNIIKENKSKVHFISELLVTGLLRKLEIIGSSYGRNINTFYEFYIVSRLVEFNFQY